ncbi:pyrimidine 5'-nucleotidase [Hamiltosporidium magnivora]|uniref:Pyrimidine 5'-nucleotidase n=1 Tax=Hamiltosporidium magnivora TaxID=148818 RepID=A0A4V2JWT2_9MICR|nr:pyrimidine 5'-nucleotidase [Hamiltosporidium magnivora]
MSRSPLYLPLTKENSTELYLPGDILVFDIDNTLYSSKCGVEKLIKNKIYEFARTLNIKEEEIKEIAGEYTKKYGLALKGFILHHDVDPLRFNELVDESVELGKYLEEDRKLKDFLNNINLHKICFTNASKVHAQRVLRCLGVEECFECIFYCDYGIKDFVCKPEHFSYKVLEKTLKKKPHEIYFYDDLETNVICSKKNGWNGFLIKDDMYDVVSKSLEDKECR